LDIQNHWAKIFIDGLVERAVIGGFPDRTFRPNSNLTRAQFAAIVSKAFSVPDKRPYIRFIDIPATHWVAAAIETAYKRGFI
jgi:S-layer homology domain